MYFTILVKLFAAILYDDVVEAAGFHEKVIMCDGVVFKDCNLSFCTSRQGIINISRTGSIFSFRKRSKFARMAEHFEYNHIPAQMSSINNFRVRSVVCHRDHLVVLHLSRSTYSQFGLLDLRLNKFLGEFGKQRIDFVPEGLVGEISPNKTRCLIRLPALLPGRRGLARQQNDRFQLYDLRAKTLLAEYPLPFNSCHFAFDPRYSWRQLAITNFEPQQDNSVSVVRIVSHASSTSALAISSSNRSSPSSTLPVASSRSARDTGSQSLPSTPANSGGGSIRWQIMTTNSRVSDVRPTLYPYLKDMRYTSDGSLLIVTMLDTTCNCREKRTRRDYRPITASILVMDSDSLQPLHCVEYHRYTCTQHLCPINYTWIISSCGSRLAVAVDKLGQPDNHYIQVINLINYIGIIDFYLINYIQVINLVTLLNILHTSINFINGLYTSINLVGNFLNCNQVLI